MTRRALAGLAVCLTLICTLFGTAGEARAQFAWSYYTGYYPSYSTYYAGYAPSYTSYYSGYAPSCVTCASPCVTCAAPCAPCQPCAPCAVGCAPATMTAGTAGAVTGGYGAAPQGAAPHGATPPGTPTTCRKCTIDDAQVYAGPQGLLYIDGERGFVQMEWGGRLRYAEVAFSRQDDDFRYYEQLPPPGEEPMARPPVWSVTLRPCPECKHAIWHNYDQAGARGWTKVQSAEVRCVTPLAPPSTQEERRRPPSRQDDGFELERREKQSGRSRDSGWTTVPQRSSGVREGNVAWVSAESDPLPELADLPTTRRTTAPKRLAGKRESTLRISRAARLRD